MSGDLKDYIAYRITRAEITLNDAIILAENKSWNSCVNRLYYACFYAVSALLIKRGLVVKSHNGARIIFFKEYIATGIINKEFSKLYTDLADWRSEGDYTDFIDYDEESVSPMIGKTKDFIKVVKEKISTA
jgi:uncharacterized protein (UPF0332 family)